MADSTMNKIAERCRGVRMTLRRIAVSTEPDRRICTVRLQCNNSKRQPID